MIPGLQVALLAVLAARVELRWSGPPDCGEEVFTAALARYVATAAAETTPVTVTVRAAEGRWALELTVADGGTRRLTASSCAVVVDAGAFVVAQALGGSVPLPEAPTGATETTEAPVVIAAPVVTTTEAPRIAAEPEAPVVVEAPTVAEAPTRVKRPRGRPWGAVRVRGGISSGALPRVGGALGLVASIGGARWRVDVAGHGRLPVRIPTAAAEVEVQLAMWAASPRGCWLPRAGKFEFPLCAGFEVGQARGRSRGLAADGRDAVVWAAGVASPGIAWAPRRWLALVLEAEVAIGLVRHDWVIRNLEGPVSRLGAADVRGFLGVELRFGGAKNP